MADKEPGRQGTFKIWALTIVVITAFAFLEAWMQGRLFGG